MRLVCLVVVAVLLEAEVPKLPEPYQSIVELTHAAPPEFAADALLRIAESRRVVDRDARLGLVEEAFHLAATATFRVRMRGYAISLPDTRPGLLSDAYALKLDALSLQSRAVMDLLAIDAARARQLFLEIPRPKLEPLTCDDALVYDLTDFYRLLGAMASVFTEQERSKEEHINLLLDSLAQSSSPTQLAPLAAVVQTANVTAAQREVLWTKFNGILESLQPDGRSFAASLNEIRSAIPVISQASFEKYKTQSPGCPNDAGGKPGDSGGSSTPKLERYWQSSEAQRLLEDGRKLRTGADGKMLSDNDRAQPEWQYQLAGYLTELAAWGPGSEKSEAEYYHQKSIIYRALVELIPPGPLRDKTLQEFLAFVSNSSLYQQSPVEWFMQANAMLERVRHTNNGEPGKVLEAFDHSGNPVLRLEFALEKTLGPNQPAWVVTSENLPGVK